MNTKLRNAIAATFILTFAAGHASAAEPDVGLIDAKFLDEIRGWAHHPVTLIALKAQNKRHHNLTKDKVLELDKQWVEERKRADQPLIAQLFGSPLSTYLTRVMANSDGLLTEVFVMDNKGLNVGQSSVTSDYWQGDEAKWQKTFLVGSKAVFVDKPNFDKKTGTRRVQVNLSIADGHGDSAIGAITVEVNLDELARRKTARN